MVLMHDFIRGLRTKSKLFGIIAVVAFVTAIILVACLVIVRQGKQAAPVNSYESCVAAGNPVVESYPEVCVSGGKSYTNPQQIIPGSKVSPGQS